MLKPTILAVLAMSVFSTLATANAEPPCKQLEGKWTGKRTLKGGSSIPITITFGSSCKYRWRDGQASTSGYVYEKNGKLQYANQAGSRGVVSLSGASLTFRNVFTGNNYVVSVRK
jgi:hypothetical protein